MVDCVKNVAISGHSNFISYPGTIIWETDNEF